MYKISIKICDDEQYYLEELYRLIDVYGKLSGRKVDIKAYQDVEDLLRDVIVEGEMCHIIFMDVEMPDMSGVDAAERLRDAGYDGVLCFVTGFDKYALDAYRLEALGYITKPAKYEEVRRLLDRAVIEVFYKLDEQEAKRRFIEICVNKNKQIIEINEILYIEKRRNQSIVHTENGELVCYETLSGLYDRLDHEKFCYVHQGFIVNFEKIKDVRPNCVALGYGREVPVSRKYYKALKERHMDIIYKLREAKTQHKISAQENTFIYK